jgi:hypothetical protein
VTFGPLFQIAWSNTHSPPCAPGARSDLPTLWGRTPNGLWIRLDTRNLAVAKDLALELFGGFEIVTADKPPEPSTPDPPPTQTPPAYVPPIGWGSK